MSGEVQSVNELSANIHTRNQKYGKV